MTDLAPFTRPGTEAAEWNRRYGEALMGTYGVPQRVLARGEGCYVWDADGNRYLDLLGGIAVNALGHAHPQLVGAVSAQLSTLGHVSNFYATVPQITLAERILDLLDAPPGSRVFFTNSGTEAIEAAVKLVRRSAPPGERTGIVAAQGAFHGRSLGALALTYKAIYREPFAPLAPGVVHVPYGDAAALAAALAAGDGSSGPAAAAVLEPIQGEAGVIVPPAGYLDAARAATRDAAALLVLDEVQSGIGRTGAWFAHQHPAVLGRAVGPDAPAVRPDVVALAKGLGGGIPIGAMVAFGEAGAILGAGQHGTTFGGNPVAAAAALMTLHVIERDGLLRNASEVGERLRAGVEGLGDELVAGTRGVGLLCAVAFTRPVSAQVAAALLERGVLVNAPTPDTLRLAPPLILSAEQADAFVERLGEALDAVRAQDGSGG